MQKIILLAFVLVLMSPAVKAESESVNNPAISIENLVASPPTDATAKSNAALMKGMPSGPTMDGFGSFVNKGHVSDQITGITSPAFKITTIVLWVRGSLVTRALPLAIPPNDTVTLNATTEFLRFYGVTGDIQAGTYVPVTFHFAHSPDKTINMACVEGKDDSGL